jgi:hypothetical protein
MREGIAADIGVDPIQASLRFNYRIMTVKGCKCPICMDWKTTNEYRDWWILRETR